ncbi:MAG: translation initiation factor IF-2 [Veillonella sp.]|jgi:translation initiation factor IF-2|uniref:translation initiation factor IF-2 n=1 Tax=Veillonella sp. TaxID=1926307 RepID=UPI001B7A3AC1|nr:translation initiation factor IF-2 [Veillonella sp.]MBP6922494.1 translation initiation factor IF-2 [Veillonella sp.]MBP8617329.1 translation initiation factor IF-2 [Veillonella sp.]MBP9551054.1 translation initiation factor IF-2 [Veillonella sp.]
MSKKRVHEVAKEFGVDNKQVITILQQHNIPVKTPLNSVDDNAYAIVKQALSRKGETQKAVPQQSGASKTEAVHKEAPKAQHTEKQHGSNGHKQEQHKQGGKPQEQKQHGKQYNQKSGFRHVQINEPTNKNNNAHGNNQGKPQNRPNQQTQQGNNRPNNVQQRQNDTRNNDNRNNDNRSNNNRNNDNRPNNNRNADNRQNDTRNNNQSARSEQPNRNDERRNKKNKKGSQNRPQSLLSTSMQKKKNRVKQRNEQYIQHKEEEKRKAESAIATVIELSGPLSVKDLAEKMGREVSEIIKKLMLLGVMATINQEVDVDTATVVAEDFGVEVVEVEPDEDPTEIQEIEDAPETLKPRPPVVTIMGHVDHGKTSLLDVIRQTNVTASEAGGITQHIGAYQVRYNDNKITFLDTPGHEAFTAMRLRGAKSTDIAVLVVAADDGVMPQTIEAINHAKSAGVPIIVAINKMDKPGANPDHVKQQLSEHGIMPEEWGGDTIMVPVSAKQRMGIDDLLENILLVAEVMELKANPNRRAQGIVIEAQLDKGRGAVCTVLVQKGSLRVGDTILAGTCYGKVRAMTNERGEKVKVARPSMPVEILGFSEVPQAGEIIDSVEDNEARTIAEKRIAKQRVQELQSSHKITLDDIFNQIQQGELKDLNIIIKADVQGSVEALRQSLESIKNDEVRIVIVHAAVGAINESDIMLASASNAIVMGFNVRPDANVRRVAEQEKVDLRTYRVIYDAINDVESAMRGMLSPEFKEVVVGRAEVRQVISTPKAIVAGSYVTEGRITNDSEVRLIRDGIVVFEGKVDSLRRFKDEVKEVKTSFECGISLEGYRDVKEGDVIEAFLMEEIKPQL